MQPRPILIMAGGTGGHVYPALAVADYLRQKGIPLLWLGTTKGLESRIVPQNGYQLLTISISGLRGKGILKWVKAPIILSLALFQSSLILFRRRPSVVLGMGGFVSGPGGLAAWLMRIPLLIHEQNAIAGLTNRVLAHMADIVMAAALRVI
jgi:UDP-N-acetylglucosamine--N-acetylmuramyl-(pentapeptide) pyrophosphoryl-undecaprenol N-acetylglucosamine transferase